MKYHQGTVNRPTGKLVRLVKKSEQVPTKGLLFDNMVITDREIQKDLEDQDQDNHKNNRQESENDTSGLKLITDLNMEKTKETVAQIEYQIDEVQTDDLDGLGCGSLNLQPAGRIVQITNISVNFIVVGGLATE